jgi:hypothetical protein
MGQKSIVNGQWSMVNNESLLSGKNQTSLLVKIFCLRLAGLVPAPLLNSNKKASRRLRRFSLIGFLRLSARSVGNKRQVLVQIDPGFLIK